MGAILAVEGYHVLEAADGYGAIEAAEAAGGRVHLLLTDVVMSPMGGGELARRMAALLPALKVLFISGFPDDPAVRRGMEAAQVAFLAKPFSPKALVKSVRAVLDGVHAPV